MRNCLSWKAFLEVFEFVRFLHGIEGDESVDFDGEGGEESGREGG